MKNTSFHTEGPCIFNYKHPETLSLGWMCEKFIDEPKIKKMEDKMKAIELRIKAEYETARKIGSQFRLGNLILINGKITEIEAIDAYGINADECQGCVYYLYRFSDNNASLEFIPLTEEWMLRCGFIQGKETKDRNVFYGTGKFKDISVLMPTGWIMYKGATIDCCAPYIHLLQNTCFSLTGEELTIKEIAK